MTVYITLSIRGQEDLIKKFDSNQEAIEWLQHVAVPKYGHEIYHIHVDRV
jgi:hypothetical protein